MATLIDRRRALNVGALMLTTVAAGAGAGWAAGRQAAGGGSAPAHLLRQCLALAEDCDRLRAELRRQLGSALPAEAANGLLPGYLALIRRDGVPAHAAFKQRLDRIAANDSALAALLGAHGAAARTAAFAPQAEAFRDYASAWRDRWNSLTELLMAGGSYPVLEPVPPAALFEVLQAELAAA